jgi:SAM-dependent methyltransferase
MDDRAIGGAELRGALRELRVINTLLVGWLPTVEGVERLWRDGGRPRRLRIVDIGAGSGETNRVLLCWAAWRGVDLRITLLDIHGETCREAAAFNRHEGRIAVVQGDVYAPPFQPCDIATASLVLHHFPAEDIPRVAGALASVGRLGVVVNDLHRSTLAWLLISVLTRIFSRNRMILHDAPLSVRRGFRVADWRALHEHPDLATVWWGWRPFFRYVVLIRNGEWGRFGARTCLQTRNAK